MAAVGPLKATWRDGRGDGRRDEWTEGLCLSLVSICFDDTDIWSVLSLLYWSGRVVKQDKDHGPRTTCILSEKSTQSASLDFPSGLSGHLPLREGNWVNWVNLCKRKWRPMLILAATRTLNPWVGPALVSSCRAPQRRLILIDMFS